MVDNNKLYDACHNFYALATHKENHHYKDFIITVFLDDGDWVAEIARKGEKEGYMPVVSLKKETAIEEAKKKIDKALAAQARDNK